MRTGFRILALLAVVLAPGAVRAAAPTPACQRAVARAGAKFAKVVLKLGQRCAIRTGGAPTCRPRAARPTGNPALDAAIGRAARRLAADMSDACARSDLSAFARRCADPTGPPLTLAELLSCLRDSHLDRVGAMLAVEFPDVSARAQAVTGTCSPGQTCQCSCSSSPSGAFLEASDGGVL
ncbi:MAG TPA: hypothetical protein VFD84_01835 [Candidatus Binatia bacterium]|nr:hypothetical protein [Candidatus Binatia bacterium]